MLKEDRLVGAKAEQEMRIAAQPIQTTRGRRAAMRSGEQKMSAGWSGKQNRSEGRRLAASGWLPMAASSAKHHTAVSARWRS
jgi:hypothetical protein